MIRILLADDQPLLLSALETILGAQDDITVAATAADGAEAVEKARAHRIDVAVLDIRMPVLDGLAATRRIRELPRPDAKSIPIIAMTADAFDEDRQRSLQAGMNAHLSKPLQPDILYCILLQYAACQP